MCVGEGGRTLTKKLQGLRIRESFERHARFGSFKKNARCDSFEKPKVWKFQLGVGGGSQGNPLLYAFLPVMKLKCLC